MNNNIENSQFSNLSSQNNGQVPINNSFNNGMNNTSVQTNNAQMSNQPNQVNNIQMQPSDQNAYTNQTQYNNSNMQMSNNIKNKKSIPLFVKVIIGIVVAIIVISLIGKIFKSSKKSEFGLSNVDYVCTYEKKKDDVKIEATTEIVFEDNGYETSIYNKIVATYDNLTDEKVLEKLEDLDNAVTTYDQADYNVNGTTELGTTDLGYDTVVTRKGNVLTITSTNFSYNGYQTLSSSDKKKMKESYEESGYTCK